MKLLYCFLGLLPHLAVAQASVSQQTWSLKPLSITLPRINTVQQTNASLVPQAEGSFIYNTTEKTVAVHDGTGWQYLGSGVSEQFPNYRVFGASGSWTIPAGVTQFMVEGWGAGAGGGSYDSGSKRCIYRGGAGGYGQAVIPVVVGVSTVSITVGLGGVKGVGGGASGAGGSSSVYYNSSGPMNNGISFGGGTNTGRSFAVSNFFSAPVSVIQRTGTIATPVIVTSAQRTGTDVVLALKLSDGGVPYGSIVGFGGLGSSIVLLNNTTQLFFSEDDDLLDGSYPAGGGGCGYSAGGDGRNGLVIVRW